MKTSIAVAFLLGTSIVIASPLKAIPCVSGETILLADKKEYTVTENKPPVEDVIVHVQPPRVPFVLDTKYNEIFKGHSFSPIASGVFVQNIPGRLILEEPKIAAAPQRIIIEEKQPVNIPEAPVLPSLVLPELPTKVEKPNALPKPSQAPGIIEEHAKEPCSLEIVGDNIGSHIALASIPKAPELPPLVLSEPPASVPVFPSIPAVPEAPLPVFRIPNPPSTGIEFKPSSSYPAPPVLPPIALPNLPLSPEIALSSPAGFPIVERLSEIHSPQIPIILKERVELIKDAVVPPAPVLPAFPTLCAQNIVRERVLPYLAVHEKSVLKNVASFPALPVLPVYKR